eukprot:6190852-Pleurochrysis_carterae.AAC.2
MLSALARCAVRTLVQRSTWGEAVGDTSVRNRCIHSDGYVIRSLRILACTTFVLLVQRGTQGNIGLAPHTLSH